MKVLVTGGAGYIGSHTCKLLSRAGFDPIVFDNLSTGHRDAVRFGRFEHGDILDGARLDEVFAAHRPDCVVHFAASAYVGESVRDPAVYYRNNIVGSLSLLEAMRRYGVPRLVFSSSCATYGIPDSLPIVETMAQNPINPYGFTKLAIERALADYGRAYGFAWVVLRYFNAAGADPEGDLGERHELETHAIPLCIRAALGLDPYFSVFGSDYPTPDGSAVRDYIHVNDLASAHVEAVKRLMGGGASALYNLATGVGTSVFEIVRAVERKAGHTVPLKVVARRDGDPPALYASGEKAARDLGWRPQYRSVDDIVGTAVSWFVHQQCQY
jgi:UDP-arabinose 4-epimerase